ncbi:hypothetical protein KCU62_g352, partial [Aureobasidium sp. EXF-3399]
MASSTMTILYGKSSACIHQIGSFSSEPFKLAGTQPSRMFVDIYSINIQAISTQCESHRQQSSGRREMVF